MTDENGITLLKILIVLGRQTRSASTDLSDQFKTKLGKSLYKVFGVTDEVKNFDKHHLLFKNWRYERDAEICKNLIQNFAPRLVAVHRDAEERYLTWQNAFVENHMQEPYKEDMNEDVAKNYSVMVNAQALLVHFKKQRVI